MTTKIILNLLRMAFSHELQHADYFVCRYKFLESSQRCYQCSTRPFEKTILWLCPSSVQIILFLKTKITKCNCFAQTLVLSHIILLSPCWFPVFACLYADFFNSNFVLIMYLLFSCFSFAA